MFTILTWDHTQHISPIRISSPSFFSSPSSPLPIPPRSSLSSSSILYPVLPSYPSSLHSFLPIHSLISLLSLHSTPFPHPLLNEWELKSKKNLRFTTVFTTKKWDMTFEASMRSNLKEALSHSPNYWELSHHPWVEVDAHQLSRWSWQHLPNPHLRTHCGLQHLKC